MQGSIPSIRGAHVQSGAFALGAKFQLFEEACSCRASVVFGRNGAGKTTISREIAGIASETSQNGYLYDDAGNSVVLSESERSRVRVFNEDYVRRRLFIEGDGVESIVMLGDQAEAKKKICKIEQTIIELGERFTKYAEVKDSCESGRGSIGNLEKAAKSAAKDGGWAERRSAIEGRKPNLTQACWDAIIASEVKESRSSLQGEFDRKLTDYKKAEAVGSTIPGRAPELDALRFDEDGLISLLAQKLDEPVLTDRERRIMALLQEGDQFIVERARDVFSRDDTKVCPMCQQEVTPEHRDSIEKSILRVLGDAVDAYREKLEKARIPEVPEDVEALDGVPEELLVGYRRALATANQIISSYDELVDRRLEAIYAPTETPRLGLSEAIASVNAAASAVNKEIDSVNASVRNGGILKEKLLKLNDQIARLDAKNEIAALNRAREEYDDAATKLKQSEERRSRLEEDLGREQARMAQTHIAVKAINAFLANVYFDADRLVLVPEGNVYKIRSHGKPVRPCNISAGERNVLSLCYFFSESGRGRFEGSEDSDPQYIILDDPISSFDMESEIGICSLMRERFETILAANEESRITVMTHSVSVMHEMEHILSDLKKTFKASRNKKLDYAIYRLAENSTETYEMRKTEYQNLLKLAYDFASSDVEDIEETYVIGNVLRRIVEGYSTFNYGVSMEMLARDPDLVKRLGPASEMLSAVMYRLALNDESHLKDRVASLNPMVGFGQYSYDEKRIVARCVLVMLFRFDQEHVIKHLLRGGVSSGEVKKSIEEWENTFVLSK